jgi:hypothetical protein
MNKLAILFLVLINVNICYANNQLEILDAVIVKNNSDEVSICSSNVINNGNSEDGFVPDVEINYEANKILIKNNQHHDFEISKIKNANENDSQILPANLLMPIKIAGKASYDLELQSNICHGTPDFLNKNMTMQFFYKNIIDGVVKENSFYVELNLSCDSQNNLQDDEFETIKRTHEEALIKAKDAKQKADAAQKELMDSAIKMAVEKAKKTAAKAREKAINAAIKKTIKEEASLRKQIINEKINDFKQKFHQKNAERKK